MINCNVHTKCFIRLTFMKPHKKYIESMQNTYSLNKVSILTVDTEICAECEQKLVQCRVYSCRRLATGQPSCGAQEAAEGVRK